MQSIAKTSLSGDIEKETNISGYRLTNMDILAELFEKMTCQECVKTDLVFSKVRHKCCSCGYQRHLFCKSCGWKHEFYTSRKINHFFKVNRRFVYVMRVIGKRETTKKRFCGVINMLQPKHIKGYDQHNKVLSKLAQVIAEKTMYEEAR